MYKTSKAEFLKSQSLLTGLMERHQNDAVVPAWLALGKVLQISQGWAGEYVSDISKSAIQLSNKASSLNANSSFTSFVGGLVSCYLQNDFDKAEILYQTAIDLNPSEALAWLYKGVLHAFKGDGELAVQHTMRACELSPVDPYLHFYQSLTASAYLTAANYERCIEMAKLSLKVNTMHVSTRRVLTIAQVMAGQIEDAQVSAKHLMLLDPTLSVSNYLSRIPGSQYGVGKKFAEALRIAGVPA